MGLIHPVLGLAAPSPGSLSSPTSPTREEVASTPSSKTGISSQTYLDAAWPRDGITPLAIPSAQAGGPGHMG